MNVEKWPIEKIMQLPDWCFGERFIVSCAIIVPGGTTVWDISEIPFPNVCVLWNVNVFSHYHKDHADYIRIALGEKLPTSTEQMDQLVPLIRGYGYYANGQRRMYGYLYVGQETIRMRKVLNAQGRRLVVEGVTAETNYIKARIFVEVSSIPKEVPDWLISGLAGYP